MIRWPCTLILLAAEAVVLQPRVSVAQEARVTDAQEARVSVEVSEDSVALGQPVTLRVKVLVPTFMPKPPQFPDFEVPGLLVRLPERASGPVSETIEGETWSGVQRGYRMYPLAPGPVSLPAQDITVTVAKGAPGETVTESLPLPAVGFTAAVPEGARALNPLIIATGFTLEETVEGADEVQTGGAVTRTLTARIEGTTPILIPALAPDGDTGSLRAYADEPEIRDQEDRGELSGTRRERIVYVPQEAGVAVLPAIAFDWYNLDTGTVERAELPAHEISVTAGPETGDAPEDPARILRLAAAVLMGVVLAAGLWRWAGPPLRRARAGARQRWLASEGAAHRQVRAALRNRDLTALLTALDVWAARVPDLPDAGQAEMSRALAAIGAAHYGPVPGADGPAWLAAGRAYAALRTKTRSAGLRARHAKLPALNPGLNPRRPHRS